MIQSRTIRRAMLAASLAVFLSQGVAEAQSPRPDLTNLTIEDLMHIEITSASRKEEHVTDVAAAVFVITSDDIRRSGMTTIPDLLRLVPGVEVAQLNSNKWAVSIRGFNAVFANKLLVLVDGRSIYNPIFSGVIWDDEGLMIDDVDRIEVIRGPGAAIWGANALNGVINIVTKSATETQGGLVRVDAGRAGEQGAVRYGGTRGAASYRLNSQWSGRAPSVAMDGAPARDPSRNFNAGFRTDWTAQPGAFMLQGGVTTGRLHVLWPNLDPRTAAHEPVAGDASTTQGANLLGRWTRTGPRGSSLQIQTFVDVASHEEPLADYARHSFDVDAQYHGAVGARHDLVAGAGYRLIKERLTGLTGLSITPEDANSSLLTGFVQDEIGFFGKRMAVTLGSQLQYDSAAGAGVQPTARVIWKGLPHQRLWAAASSALRTPALIERRLLLEYPPAPTDAGLPLFVVSRGNPAARSETLADAEVGYRVEIGTKAAIDVTGFVGGYRHLVTREVSAPLVQFVPSPRIVVNTAFGNQLEADTRGLEISGHWTPLRAWRLDGGYSAFHLTPRLAVGSQDPIAGFADGNAPRAQWRLGSAFSPTARVSLNVALFHVGRLERLGVDAYTRADVDAEWRFTNRLSVMAIGQNLLDAAHAEFAGAESLALATQVPRSASVRLRWEYK